MLAFDDATLASALTQRDAWLRNHPGQPIPYSIMHVLDSVTNVENYVLMKNGVEVAGGIVNIEYGMNMASHLAQMAAADPAHYGQYADLGNVPSNHFEAVITFAGAAGLDAGTYTLVARTPVAAGAANPSGRSGLVDASSQANALGHNGFQPAGADFTQQFSVVVDNSQQDPGVGNTNNGHTYAESPRAVAVDGDGDHVVVWTQTVGGVDRVYYEIFNAAGASISSPAPVSNLSPTAAQRYATVACDADGDFVVTWTQFDAANDANVYGCRFSMVNGAPEFQVTTGTQSDGSFRINSYTDNNQEWSSVAMDSTGNFVVTWTSYGQEDNGQNGLRLRRLRPPLRFVRLRLGFRISGKRHHRRQPAGFQCSPGRQRCLCHRVAEFAKRRQRRHCRPRLQRRRIAHSIAEFLMTNTELPVNSTTAGNQRYPDVSIDLAGTTFVVAWQSSGQDGNGWGVYSRQFAVVTPPVKTYTKTDGRNIPDPVNDFQSPLTITDNVLIADVKVHLDIVTPHPADLTIWLTKLNPDGTTTTVILCTRVPRPINGTVPTGANFLGTTFDDAAATSIDNDVGPNAALPPFPGSYIPEQLLAAFDGLNAAGTWTLHIRDSVGELPLPDNQYLLSWSLEIQPASAFPEARANTSIVGDQMYPSVAMAYDGSYAITWSGSGNQPNQADTSGVFYQRFNQAGQRVGGETRANMATFGNQWLSSVGSDSSGNIVIVWTGPGSDSGTTNVYKFTGSITAPVADLVGPIVTDVLTPDATNPTQLDRVLDGGAVLLPNSGLTQITVQFDERMDALANVQTSLTASITSTATTIHVASAAGFPTSGQYTIVVDNEQMIVTAGFGTTTWTVTRGANSTAKVGHASGTPVALLIDPVFYAHSLLNPANWSLYRDGSDITGAITHIDFGLNSGTNKWTAVLTINGSGLSGGQAELTSGNYVLVLDDTVWDAAHNYDAPSNTYMGNALDGDFDGQPGTNAAATQPGFSISFSVATSPVVGAEHRVDGADANGNNDAQYDQGTSQVIGTGSAREQTVRSVAVDHSGDFAAVWTSYGQDNPSDAFGGGVYMRLYAADNNPMTNDILVNTTTVGNQHNATIAMDADGDFVVVWAKRCRRIPTEVGASTPSASIPWATRSAESSASTRPTTNDQVSPAVAMDSFGNFVVVWATMGQSYSYFNDVHGQIYDSDGQKVGAEFRVNSVNIPGTSLAPGSNEVHPSIAMNDTGAFIVTWDQVSQQVNGIVTDTNVVGRLFT